jgi:putative FmdB family regulatory protein
MPTYEYECTSSDCRHRFEAFQSIKARPLRKCPACGNTVKRLIGAGAGIIFRGSGFYITDYRSKDYKDRARADRDASATKANSASAAKPGDSAKSGDPAKPSSSGSSGKMASASDD